MAMHDNDDLDNIPQTTGLISGSPRTPGNMEAGTRDKDKADMPFCGCLSMRYYQPYFDIDTQEIYSRIIASVFYCRSTTSFIATLNEKPDLYGPFWITTSLVFTVAVTSHMSSWLQSWLTGINWQYDLQSMVNAASVIYGYAGLAPVAAYFGLGQIGVDIKLLSLICLYGYSLGVFIAASLVCLMPSQMAIWIALLVAAGVSAVFLMRNLAPLVMQVSPANVQSASIAIAIVQLVFIIFLKRAIF